MCGGQDGRALCVNSWNAFCQRLLRLRIFLERYLGRWEFLEAFPERFSGTLFESSVEGPNPQKAFWKSVPEERSGSECARTSVQEKRSGSGRVGKTLGKSVPDLGAWGKAFRKRVPDRGARGEKRSEKAFWVWVRGEVPLTAQVKKSH